MNPDISLIVATIGRVECLHRLLDSLLLQSEGNIEIIVVNQDSSPEPVGTCLKKYDRDLQLIHIHDSGTGLSRARNIGLRRATGRIIGFPDDDCWYAEDVLDKVRSLFQRHDEIGLLCGIYSEPGHANLRFPDRPANLTRGNVVGRVCSVGIFVRRELLNSNELYFDEVLGAGSDLPAAEEVDFAMRLLGTGTQGLYCPSLLVYHAIDRNNHDTRLMEGHQTAYWYMIGKHFRTGEAMLRLARGFAAAVFKASPLPMASRLRAMLRGYRLGRQRRWSDKHS